jgi:hypothetical protein
VTFDLLLNENGASRIMPTFLDLKNSFFIFDLLVEVGAAKRQFDPEK